MTQCAVWQLRESEKVCGIDIDDVLCLGTEWWIDFVNNELRDNNCYSHKFTNLTEMKNALSYNQYRALKMKYRECGIKLHIPIMPYAKELTQQLKKMGYKIVLLTARPVQTHYNLFSTTVKWLEKHEICYDGIIWGEDKNYKILVEVPHLNFMVEDNHFLAESVAKLGVTVFLLTNKYNEGKETHKNVVRISKLEEVIEWLKTNK